MEGLGINWKILIGDLINFVILFFLLKKFVFTPFFAVLKKRQEKIESGVKKSEEAEKSLQRIRELEIDVKEAGEKKSREIIKEAQGLAEKRKQDILAQAETEKEKILLAAKETAKKEIEQEKEKQKKETIDLSFLLAEKFLKEKIDRQQDEKLLKEIAGKIK